MLLSEGQMSDFKGAALMLPALPKARELLADKATTPIGSAPLSPSAASPPAFLRNPIGRSRSPMTPSSTNSATKSKTCSGASKTGGESTRYDRCAHTYFSAICIAAAVAFWL
jgi:hypothetical protein